MTGADELQAIVTTTERLLDAAPNPLDDLIRHTCMRQCIEGMALARAAELLDANNFGVAHDLVVLAARLAASMALREVQDPDNRAMIENILANVATLPAPAEIYPRAPDIESCLYDAEKREFVVTFVGGRTERLAVGLLKSRIAATITDCKVDEFRRGVEVYCGDKEPMTDLSGDFVLYTCDPDFRARTDAATAARVKGRLTADEIDAIAADHGVVPAEPTSED